jgi:hypothetical protein
MQDFEIRLLNSGEVGISALTERAQAKARCLKPGHRLVFRSPADPDAVAYVDVLEAEGFTVKGRELLQRR